MANNFGLFFTRDGQVIRLPVNPEQLPVEKDNANDDYNVLGIGPIMVPRIPKQRVVTISSFFPGRVFPGILTSNGFQPPEFYINFFNSAMNEKAVILYTPVRYYENGEPFMQSDTGFQVLVTSFTYTEKGGETGDFYYDLELTEYRDYSPQTMQIQTPATSTSPATVSTEKQRDIPQGQIVVGSTCIANGQYCYTSYGDGPFGTANGQRVVVSRIVDGSRPDCVHITTEDGSPLGWLPKSALQVVSST
jgi:peptidoglycan-binding lysin domain protein|nr:MAG TPA: tail assembly protein [Caudoviricetes sp.]